MPYTKRRVVERAFEELAIAGYSFDLNPEEMQSGLERLDSMMAEWASRTIHVGYNFGPDPDASDLDDDTGVPLIAISAMRQHLAISIAASKGKVLSQSTKQQAKQAMDALLVSVAHDQIRAQSSMSLPAGAGNRRFRRTYIPSSSDDTSY